MKKQKYNLVMVCVNVDGKPYAQLQTLSGSNAAVEFGSEAEAVARANELINRKECNYINYIVLFVDTVYSKLRKA